MVVGEVLAGEVHGLRRGLSQEVVFISTRELNKAIVLSMDYE